MNETDRMALVDHLRADHGWTPAQVESVSGFTGDELLEEHDNDHTLHLDPHRAGEKDA